MPALNFKKEFVQAIEDGEKRQTIRADRRDNRQHAKVGDTLKLYTGMRTKSCRLIGKAKVTRTARVLIEATCMRVNGHLLPNHIYDLNCEQTDNEFAMADGFDGFMEMSLWFDKVHGLPFEGTVICWDELR